ncbi:MAG: MFS transporter [Chloroflexia bacterium]|nr:MFS transporter [Chloroflexia bacterium]
MADPSPKLVRPKRPRRRGSTAATGVDGARAWLIVAALTVILMVASGARFLFGIVLKPVSEQFGWDRAELTGAVLLGTLTLSLCQPLVGFWIDRIGPTKIVVAGCALLGLALLPLAAARELWQVYLFWGVLASLGLAATSPVNATAFVGRWFDRKRGTALSVATAGSAFAQLLIVPVGAWTMTVTDWQTTYRLLALALLAGMAPLGLLLLRDGPPRPAPSPGASSGSGSGSGSGSESESTTGPGPEPGAGGDGVALRTALRAPDFWLLALGFVVCGWTMAFPNTHFIAYADDMGMSVLHAANAVSVTAVFSIAGSVLLGLAADRHKRTSVLALVYALRGLAFLLLLLLPVGNLVYLYAVVLGISWTATTPLTAAIAADRYGTRHLGIIFGTMFTFMNLGFGLGSFVNGAIYDATGGYGLSLVLNVLLGVVATVGVLAVDKAPKLLPARAAERRRAAVPAAD